VPIYEFNCPACGRTFEKLQSLEEKPVAPCPECGEPAEKIMSASGGYVMKGQNRGRSPGWPREKGPCCGQGSGCENPKRCCTK
jgi:putative FmdB family regulatory protein